MVIWWYQHVNGGGWWCRRILVWLVLVDDRWCIMWFVIGCWSYSVLLVVIGGWPYNVWLVTGGWSCIYWCVIGGDFVVWDWSYNNVIRGDRRLTVAMMYQVYITSCVTGNGEMHIIATYRSSPNYASAFLFFVTRYLVCFTGHVHTIFCFVFCFFSFSLSFSFDLCVFMFCCSFDYDRAPPSFRCLWLFFFVSSPWRFFFFFLSGVLFYLLCFV